MAVNEDLVHGWVSTDCGRGTSNILWSCLATILLCVWTVIHLPVPCCSRFEEGELVPGEPSRSSRNWIIRSGIVPAIVSVIAPEFLTVISLGEFVEAWSNQGRIQNKMAQMDWTLTHAFFLQAGGFCLETPSGLRLQLDQPTLESAISMSPEWLSGLEKVKEDHINDHAKSNPLTKFIACGQTLWLVTQVLSRVCQHHAVTLLEVSTTAYAACALTAYAAWWKKPQNPTIPITIHCSAEEMPHRNMTDPSYCSEISFREYLWAGQEWSRALFNFNWVSLPIFSLCPAVFGAIHVASWNIRLVSDVEEWLWRASAIYCCTAGMIFVFIVFPLAYIYNLSRIRDATFTAAAAVGILIYVIVRLYMIIEVFASLRALQRSAYEDVQWSSFIPHI